MRRFNWFFAFAVGVLGLHGCDGESRSPTQPVGPRCLDRAVFGAPADSVYTLPFPVGEGYTVSQSYCFPSGGHRNQLAYDFAIPIGAEIVAARRGTVRAIRQDLPDEGTAPNSSIHNHVNIEHPDGTVAFYAHLMQESVVVGVGQQVARGELIALSGNSGATGGLPHLHFGVYQGWPPVEGRDVPVNFRNADGPLDERGGLIRGETYTALPW